MTTRRAWLLPTVLAVAVLLPACGERNEESDEVVIKTGSFTEDLFASGDEVTVRADVDASVIVMGGHVDVRSRVVGDVVALAGELSVGDAVSGDVVAVGGGVEVGGRIGGDIHATGGEVILDAAVAGSVLSMGGRVRVVNRIDGDLKMAGGHVENAAAVGGNIMMAGGHVILARGADIAGNALAVGGRVDIDGTIGGDMRAAGRRVVIGGEVRGNVQVDALEVSILPTAHIHGNLKYRSPNDADIHAEAVIDGDVTFIQSEEPTHAVGFAFAVAGGAVILTFIALLALGAVQVLVLPKLSFAAARLGMAEPWKSLGLGFALLVAVPIGIAILMSTLIGIILGLVLAALYLITVALGLVIAAIAVGRRGLSILGRDWDDVAWGRIGVGAVGLVVIAVVVLIPFLAMLAVGLALSLGMGSLAVQVIRGHAESGA